MPEVLLIKTSSMGDVIHNLPVATDILAKFPNASIDWVVEESFSEIPVMHPGVKNVIPVAIRRWRKHLLEKKTRSEFSIFRERISEKRYDIVLDTQGLLKSAALATFAHGAICGYDADSAREPLACLFYDRKLQVGRDLHAVTRNRLLAAKCMGYSLEDLPLDYGIAMRIEKMPERAIFLHATSRDDKLWPEERWVELGRKLEMQIHLPWGSARERERSERLSGLIPGSVVPDRLGLRNAAELISGAAIAVGVDTGLAHLAAALDVPVVGIYCSTDPGLTGILGAGKHVNLGGKEGPPAVDPVHRACLEFLGK